MKQSSQVKLFFFIPEYKLTKYYGRVGGMAVGEKNKKGVEFIVKKVVILRPFTPLLLLPLFHSPFSCFPLNLFYYILCSEENKMQQMNKMRTNCLHEKTGSMGAMIGSSKSASCSAKSSLTSSLDSHSDSLGVFIFTQWDSLMSTRRGFSPNLSIIIIFVNVQPS